MGSNSNVDGSHSLEQLWRTRLDPNGLQYGLELRGARERSTRVRKGALAGRAIAGVRKRRNESYLGLVVPEPL